MLENMEIGEKLEESKQKIDEGESYQSKQHSIEKFEISQKEVKIEPKNLKSTFSA